MIIPTEVKILNHTYKVIEVDEISSDGVDTEKDDSILGLLDDTSLQILLVKSLHPSRKYQIFLHEVIHAIFNIIDFRKFLKDQESEESVVNFVSDILLQVLTENNIKPVNNQKYDLCEDPMFVQNIISNFNNGITIQDICKTFQTDEKTVKKVLRLHKELVAKKKEKVDKGEKNSPDKKQKLIKAGDPSNKKSDKKKLIKAG